MYRGTKSFFFSLKLYGYKARNTLIFRSFNWTVMKITALNIRVHLLVYMLAHLCLKYMIITLLGHVSSMWLVY